MKTVSSPNIESQFRHPLARAVSLSLVLVWIALILLAATPRAGAEALYRYPPGTTSLEGVVIKVVSAKDLVLWQKGRLYPFRLYGISLPDPETPKGQKAKKIVSDMIFNTLLKVYLLPDQGLCARGVVIIRGDCLNETLVRLGLARVDKTCCTPEFCTQWKVTRTKATAPLVQD